MATARTRTELGNPVQGYQMVTRNGETTSYSEKSAYGRVDTCTDVIGNRDGDNALVIDKYARRGSIVNYYQEAPFGITRRIVGQPSGAYTSFQHICPRSSIDNTSILNRLLSQSGPLTPKVNLPLAIYELKDVPMMLKHAGDLLHKIRQLPRNWVGMKSYLGRGGANVLEKEAASATLAVQFGWKPLIEDMWKLINFADSVSKRQSELERAASSRGLKRKITISEDSRGGTSNWNLQSVFFSQVNIPCPYTSTQKQWATVRWKIRDEQKIGSKPTFQQAFKSAMGLNPGMIPITVWKALPWTWMIDWFTDISHVLQANYNMIYYKPSRACLMETLTTSYSHPTLPSPIQPWISEGEWKRESKYRTVLSVSPTARATLRVPFLDTFKLSILGSLTILRIKNAR